MYMQVVCVSLRLKTDLLSELLMTVLMLYYA